MRGYGELSAKLEGIDAVTILSGLVVVSFRVLLSAQNALIQNDSK